MSASIKPTFAPICASATARLTDTVVLPTPPLPLATAMVDLTGMLSLPLMRASLGTLESHLIATCFAPMAATAAFASDSI